MKKLLGVVLALCMVCIPMRIHAQDLYYFEYGEQFPFDESYQYFDLDENVLLLEAPKNVGRYIAYNLEDFIEFEIVPKEVKVHVSHNMGLDFLDNPYLYEYEGNYNFKTNIDTFGNFISYGTDCMNYSFVYCPSNISDLGVRKTIVSHEDMELVYNESGYTIYSEYEDIDPLILHDVGDYTLSFKADSSKYISKPFQVRIVPKVIEIHPILVKEYGQTDPEFETKDYILSRESGESVGDYKLTVKSKNKNYRYVLDNKSIFRILEKENVEVKGVDEEKKIDDVPTSSNDNTTTSKNSCEERSKTDLNTETSKVATGVELSLYEYILSMVLTGCMLIGFIKKVKS